MQSQYDILKCLNYMENLLSVGHIKANYEKSLYRWYDEVGQTIMSGVKVDEKENRIKIKDFLGLLHKKTQKIQKLTPSVIEKNILLLGEIFHLNKNEMDLIGLMFRHTQYAFLNNFVECFLGYHWERLDSYAMLLKLTYSQLMNMLREDGRLMQADIFSYDYHDRIELASWVNRLLISRYKNKKDMFDTIIGKPLKSKLNLTNFSHIEQVDIISLLLKNATKQKEKGINILLYGDVGSGKTEFAKVLAQENNLKLYSIAEDMGGSCNISYRRFNRLKAISQAFCKEDNLLDFYLEGKLPQATYEAKQEQIANQRAELEQTAEKYKNIDADMKKRDADMKKRVVQVMALANNISKLFDMAAPTTRNELLQLLISNCQLNGSKLEYTINAPFNWLINSNNYTEWTTIVIEHLDDFECVKV